MADTLSGSLTSYSLKVNAEKEFQKAVDDELLLYGWKPILWKRGVDGKVRKIGTRILEVDESMLKVSRNPAEIAAKINELVEFAESPKPRHPVHSIDDMLTAQANDQGRLDERIMPAIVVAGDEVEGDIGVSEDLAEAEQEAPYDTSDLETPKNSQQCKCSVCGADKKGKSSPCPKGCKPGKVKQQYAEERFEKRLAKVTPAKAAPKKPSLPKPQPMPTPVANTNRNTLLDLITERENLENAIAEMNGKVRSINRAIVEACGGVMPEQQSAPPPIQRLKQPSGPKKKGPRGPYKKRNTSA